MPRLLFFSLSTICGYNSRAATKRGRRLFLSLEQVVKLCTTTITRLKSNRELPVLSTSPLLAVRLFLTLPRCRRGLQRGLCHRRPISEPQKEGWQCFGDRGQRFARYPTRLWTVNTGIFCVIDASRNSTHQKRASTI